MKYKPITEVVFDDTAIADIKNITDALPKFQKNGPIYKKLMRVLASVEALSSRAHMFPIDSEDPRYRKCSVAGYVIQYSWQENGSPDGPVATVKRVLPSEWKRTDQTMTKRLAFALI